jgi:hypothetical protein
VQGIIFVFYSKEGEANQLGWCHGARARSPKKKNPKYDYLPSKTFLLDEEEEEKKQWGAAAAGLAQATHTSSSSSSSF